MTTGRRAVLLGMTLSLLGVVGACRDEGALATEERRPYAPPQAEQSRTVQVRNACPEAVVIAVSPTLPNASTPTMRVNSTKVEAVTVEPGARIWLRYDGRFDEELSVAPIGAVEVGYQCNGIYARNGGF